MLYEQTIGKQKNREAALDYEQLYALGLKHVQSLAQRVWTDYNVHDPGLTTLELLCYALTDLSYRAAYPTQDLLAVESGNVKNMQEQFFTARRILPNRALTAADFRKLLIDLKDVKNAWVRPTARTYYADKVEGALFGPATMYPGDIVDLPSLAIKLKQPSEPLSAYLTERLSAGTRQALAEYEPSAAHSELQAALAGDLNRMIQSHSIYDEKRFAAVTLSGEVQAVLEKNLGLQPVSNRLLLEDAYPGEISKHQALRAKATLPGLVEVKVAGLYEVLIDFEDSVTSAGARENVMKTVRQRLEANRNLCEDFLDCSAVESQSFLLCAELELAPDADVSETHAQILFQVQQYLAPAIANYTLSEMLARKKPDGTPYTAAETFDGPALDCGFIDDSELEGAELRAAIRLSDVISIIMDIDGVQAVRDIIINPDPVSAPLENKWMVAVEPGKKALLNRDASRLVFYKRNMPVIAKPSDMKARYDQLAKEAKAKTETEQLYDFDPPLGKYRDPKNYHSFQNHFPAVYGLSESGLSSAADERRKALAYQLKAYLLFYDQVMANYFAQLAHVKELFSTDPEIRQTYFYQKVKSITDYAKIYATSDIDQTLKNVGDNEATQINRRNRFLDHLIARFAERFNDYVNVMVSTFGATPASLTVQRCQFLRHYETIGSERSLAYNKTLKENEELWESENVSGLEKRLARLLGLGNFTRRNLSEIGYDSYAEIDDNSTDGFHFRIRRKDTAEIILSSSTGYATPELAKREMQEAIRLALLPSGYQRKTATNGKYYFNVVDNMGDAVAGREYFDSEEEMNEAIEELIEYLRVNYSDEGMFIIENLLLRPAKQDDPFLPICPDPGCPDCVSADPYSYRIHVVLPAYSSRFSNMEFRRYAEDVIRAETPAHILPKICWIDAEDMAVMEKAYRDWIYLTAGAATAERAAKLNALIEILFKIKNVYPVQRLRECGAGEDQAKFILGQSALGTLKLDIC